MEVLEVIESTVTGMPALDIMMPTHNMLHLTMRSVMALYQHTQSPFHLIVCDDSTDKMTPNYFKELISNGVAPLNKCPNITYVHVDSFKEGNQFFNVALKYCKSEYFTTVMNSVRVEPEWELAALNNLMPNNPTVGIIGFKSLFAETGRIESAGIKVLKYLPTDIGRDFPGHRLCGVYECDAVQWAFALHRKKALLGNLEEGIFHGHRGWDDIDNCYSVKAKGWKILYCGMGVCYHEPRASRGNNSKDAERENRENGERFYKRWGLWDMYLKDHPNQEDIHALPKMEVMA